MQQLPLSLTRILEYGSTVHSGTRISNYHTVGNPDATFGEVAARAAALAHALHDELGITGEGGEHRVASLMYNCSEHVEALFAAACMGAVFHPLNKQLQESETRYIINHAEDEVIIADPRLADLIGRLLPQCPTVRSVIYIGTGDVVTHALAALPERVQGYSYEALLDARPTEYPWPTLDETDAAVLCYSTGTTGGPKGVVYSHRSMYLHAMSLRTTDSFAVAHGMSFLCCVPIYHVLSWGVPVAAFMCGAPLVLPGSDVSAPALAGVIAEAHPRAATGVPTLWISLMVHYLSHPPERMSLREIFAGGSPVPPVLITMWEQRYGVDVIHVWGMTETSPIGTVARPPSGASGEARWNYRRSQGRFPASMEYRVVSDDGDVTGTDRDYGELQVRGNWVTGEYFQPVQPSDEEAVDIASHFTEDGWLRTGDVGSVTADGYLILEDRIRDIIRSGGEWIFSIQLENLVMEHDDVVEAAVIGFPDDKWGERPLAVTVLHEGVPRTRETAERLRDHMRASLPGWMLPEYWTFVDAVETTSVGKFNKRRLRERLAAGEFPVIKLKGPGER